MLINPMFDNNRTNMVLQSAIEGRMARHRAIVHNIANVDTPGFQRIEVSFEDNLKRAIDASRPPFGTTGAPDAQRLRTAFEDFTPRATLDRQTPLRADGSNVSIDREMAELSKNSGRTTALLELLNRNYRMLKTAIRGRNV